MSAAAPMPGQHNAVPGAFSANPPGAAYTEGTARRTLLAAGYIPASMRVTSPACRPAYLSKCGGLCRTAAGRRHGLFQISPAAFST